MDFHGGEPLVLGKAWLEECVRRATEIAGFHKKKIGFGIVTNATLLDDDICLLLKRHDISTCVSMDGPPSINDVYRQRGADTLEALARLEKNDKPFRILGVINPANWDKMQKVADFFIANRIFHVKFNIVHKSGRGKQLDCFNAEMAFHAQKTILDKIIETQGSFIEVNVANKCLKFLNMHTRHDSCSC